MSKTRGYCFTIFGTQDELRDWIVTLEPVLQAKCGVAQIEIAPATGSFHIQGAAYFASPISMKSIIKKLNLISNNEHRCHVEKMHGTWEESVIYCTKLESRFDPNGLTGTTKVRWGQADEPSQGKRSDLDACTTFIKESMKGKLTVDECMKEVAGVHPETYVKFTAGLRALAETLYEPKEIVAPEEWKPWQAEVITMLEREPHDRAIFWIYGPGGEGKTVLIQQLVTKMKGCVLNGKLDDMMFAWKPDYKIAIFDMPKVVAADSMAARFEMAERLQNRIFMSPKYASALKVIPRPHIIFIGNQLPPDPSPWTDTPGKGRMVTLTLSGDIGTWNYRNCAIEPLSNSAAAINTSAALTHYSGFDPAIYLEEY